MAGSGRWGDPRGAFPVRRRPGGAGRGIMTGDQQPADLLDLPFDQYQRYRLAGEILGLLGRQQVLPAAPAILDVGGYPGLLPRFVTNPGARTVVLDVVPDTGSAHRYGY